MRLRLVEDYFPTPAFMFMKAGVVDNLYIDMQATVFGAGVGLFNDTLDAKLVLQDIERLGDNNVLLHYSVTQ